MKKSAAVCLALLGLAAILPLSAIANDLYSFSLQNDLDTAVTIYVNGRAECDAPAGGSCRVSVSTGGDYISYAPVGSGNQMPVDTGNLSTVKTCRLSGSGTHCSSSRF